MKSLFISGPTAVGKTDLAIRLAGKLNGEIISVDSRQIYKGLDIGTSKPAPTQQKSIPHHMIDIVNLNEHFDVQQFVTAAANIKNKIVCQGKVPIFCGGTGLYFKAYLEGLDPFPAADHALRRELEKVPIRELLAELEASDPRCFAKIDRKNQRRLVRAIEIIRLTGKPFSSQRTRWQAALPASLIIVLNRPSSSLRRRIEDRVERMFAKGLVEETEHLLHLWLDKNVMNQTLGYREVIDYLKDRRSFDGTIELVKRRTWQFARRQLTWFRGQSRSIWLDIDDVSSVDLPAVLLKKLRMSDRDQDEFEPF